MPELYDAHNHLQDEWLAPYLDKIGPQLDALGLAGVVVNGTNEADWDAVVALSLRFNWVRPSFGLHPWDVGNRSELWLKKLSMLLDHHPRAGVGEIGLDRWILDRARPDDPRLIGLRRAPLDEQKDVFVAQLRLAAERNRPVSIHCLEAWGALNDVIRDEAVPARGFLLHAYNGSAELAQTFAERGAYFSFNGAFLAERHEKQRETFKKIPADRLLVETDAPAMIPPQAWRTHKLPPSPGGQAINHPGNLEAAYAGLAALRGIPVSDLALQVANNFRRWFD
jgi:TatD DNase family protein